MDHIIILSKQVIFFIIDAYFNALFHHWAQVIMKQPKKTPRLLHITYYSFKKKKLNNMPSFV